MIAYLDTSAALKLFVEEDESDAFRQYWRETTVATSEPQITSGWLLHTELHCAARRWPETIDADLITEAFRSVTLVDVARADFIAAGQGPERLRSADAVHLAIARRLGTDTMVAYDGELLAAAQAAGLETVSPR